MEMTAPAPRRRAALLFLLATTGYSVAAAAPVGAREARRMDAGRTEEARGRFDIEMKADARGLHTAAASTTAATRADAGVLKFPFGRRQARMRGREGVMATPGAADTHGLQGHSFAGGGERDVELESGAVYAEAKGGLQMANTV